MKSIQQNPSGNASEFDVKVCATPAGPCVESRSADPVKVAVGLGIGTAVAVGAAALFKALTSPPARRRR
jgi:hypothetical protein